MPDEQPLLLIGNPDNRRTSGLQEARERMGMCPAVVLSYEKLLRTWRQGGTLAELVKSSLLSSAPLIRLDAPGEDWHVERGLLHLGATENEMCSNQISGATGLELAGIESVVTNVLSSSPPMIGQEMLSAEACLTLKQQWGRIYAPAQWFRGWKACLERIRVEAREVWPDVRFWNEPEDIGLMFDKRACQRHLARHGISVPPLLSSSQPVTCRETLRAAMEDSRMHRVFVKLACGSGASGVVAYQMNPRTGAEIATTTVGMEAVRGKNIFYNEGKLRKYTSPDEIGILMDWLCAEGAQIERWMPKATLGQHVYDIRQLVAAGQAGHAIMRLSRTPITNLHLRNERMLPAEAGVSEQHMSMIQQAAQQTMMTFPESWSAGIDVMLTGGMNPRAYVLDVNPFGDLLYRVQHHGLNTYEWQMMLLRKEPVTHA
ncbi:STM4014 family protein [Paenibacillus barcinonensis]|uniref:STM4014 family protein n=2 Tax=Paenibacillus barcinonensis TaxID=198119 RepID=A0ABX6Q3Z2_PAEBA|nr:STM4014 family protein [Paenibacillus barcinonensis]QKS56817.1 STM4014 family protein [Paenibacillus barcinonensis]